MVANGTDGIAVDHERSANLVERNRSHLNGDDGIDANCPPDASYAAGQITMTRNAATEW